MKYFYTIACLLLFFPIFSQNYVLKGILKDEKGMPLEFGTIMLVQVTDSALVSFTRSEENGSFIIEKIPAGNYTCKITYLGTQEFREKVTFSASTATIQDLGVLTLLPVSKLLQEVEVKAEADQVKIKKDTIEYNADSFKTVPNSSVEDLLKKLPGVEVEKDGSIKAQGEDVKNVYVNGKKFFGNDPKIATKNLQAGMIKKVQIYDKKSDISTFTGIDDGDRERSINLEIKPEMSLGWFGNAMAGGGDQGRYQLKANINKFTAKQQLSLLALGNNVNQQGFSFDEYMNFSGQTQRNMRSGGGTVEFSRNSDSGVPLNFGNNNTGFIDSWAGGINYNDNWSPKSEINSSYFFNNSNTFNDKVTNRTTFKGNTEFVTNSSETSDDDKLSHRVSLVYEWKPDSIQSIKVTSDGNWRNNMSKTTSNSTSTLLDQKINSSSRTLNNSSLGQTLRATVLYRRKFAKKGRNIAFTTSFRNNDDQGEGSQNSFNFFKIQDNPIFDTIDQTFTQRSKNTSLSGTINFTEPLGNRQYLEFTADALKNAQESNRMVYDGTTNNDFIDSLSNSYLNDYSYAKGGMSYRLVRKLYNFSTGLNYQYSQLDGLVSSSSNTPIFRSFNRLLPNIRFNYDFTSSKRLNLTYETSFREPSISQLQPVNNNTDPLNISTGNPELQPEYVHRFTSRYNSFNMLNQKSFFGNFNVTYTKDKIATFQTITPELVRISKPINTPYDLNISSFLSMGYKIGSSPFRINTGINGSFGYGFNTVNAIETTTQKYNATGSVRLEYRLDNLFEASARVRYGYNTTHYQLLSDFDQTNITQTFTIDATYQMKYGFTLSSSINIDRFQGLSSGFNSTIPIWNAYLAKTVFKNKKGEIRLAANDILNQNVGISRTTDINFVEDTRALSLARYFLLSFTYTLNKIAGNDMNPMRGMGGGRRMF